MTGERIAGVGFTLPSRAARVVELVLALALMGSIVVAGTAVSIGMARACGASSVTSLR